MSEIHVAQSEEELGMVADKLLRLAEGSKKFALVGELGAGKTAFVKAFCRRLQVVETVSSPTFALVNEYCFFDENNHAQTIHHLDLYRLKSVEEALGIGIEEYLDDDSFCFIEWPEVIAELLPQDTVLIKIEVMPKGERQFSMEK